MDEKPAIIVVDDEADAREVLSGWLLGPIGKRYARTQDRRKEK